jgi:hypothetical protein
VVKSFAAKRSGIVFLPVTTGRGKEKKKKEDFKKSEGNKGIKGSRQVHPMWQ